jgi:hypothetical protein
MVEMTPNYLDEADIRLKSEAEYGHQRQSAVTAGVDNCRAKRKRSSDSCSKGFGQPIAFFLWQMLVNN